MQEAAGHYANLLKALPNDVEALSQLAFFYLERGETGPAGTLFSRICSLDPQNRAARHQLWALEMMRQNGEAGQKAAAFYARLVGSEPGLRREEIPCLVRLNGDLIWLPGDLIRFLWHTVQQPFVSAVPSFLAETDHYLWIRERLSPGDQVLDIGSNLGIFATMMGARVGPAGRVFAFEPSARIASDLRRVLALNDLSHVTVVEAAAADRNGTAEFCDVQEEDVRRESSHLNQVASQRGLAELKQRTATVKTVVVDDLVAEHRIEPSLVKIDVEGAEFLVLEGARKTIGRYRPKLVIEFHPDSQGVFDHDRLIGYLKSYGYQFTVESKTYYAWPADSSGG